MSQPPKRTDGRTVVVHSVTRALTGFFNVDEARVSHSRFDGGTASVTRLSLERGDSVAILAVDWERRAVWLTEQFRYPTLSGGDGWIVEIPAGMIDSGETPEQAAAREALEEIGIQPQALELISRFYLSPGGSSERISLFYADVTGAPQDVNAALSLRDPDEDILWIAEDVDQFIAKAKNGCYADAKTIIAGYWLASRPR